MNNASIDHRLLPLVAMHVTADPSEIKPTAAIIADLGADSLDVVELVMAVESEFKIEISDGDAQYLITVQDLTDYILNHYDEAQ